MNTESPQSATDLTPAEKAMAGYQAAIDLWIFSAEQGWERFNIMLAANAILIAAVGLAANAEESLAPLKLILPFLGISLCVIWFLLVKRSFDFSEYYTFSARELEEAHFTPIVTTVSRGAQFAHGEHVTFSLAGKATTHRLSWPARIIRARLASYLTMLLFVVFYAIALCLFPY